MRHFKDDVDIADGDADTDDEFAISVMMGTVCARFSPKPSCFSVGRPRLMGFIANAARCVRGSTPTISMWAVNAMVGI